MTIQAGFPLDRPSSGPPQAPSDGTDKVLSYHFIARDAKNTYHVRYVAADAHGKYEHIFLWQMAFSAGETKTLNVGYTLPMSSAAGTTRKISDPQEMLNPPPPAKPWHARLEGCLHVFFYYITETGQSWAGPIERATFRFRNRVFENHLREFPEYVGGKPADLPVAAETLNELALLNDLGITTDDGYVLGMKLGTAYPDISPEGWRRAYIPEPPAGKPQPQYEPDGIAWKFENYKPGEPLSFSYYVTGFPQSAADCDVWARQVLGNNPTMADVLELREIMAAFFGIAPHTALVKRFVEQQIWYKRQSKLNEPQLTEPRRAILGRLTNLANQQRNVSDPYPQALARLKTHEPGLRDLLKGHAGEVIAVAFTPEGKSLISASCDRTIKLWDVETGKNTATLRGHANAILALALSRDGKMLASADGDGQIKLWNAVTGKNIATISESPEDLLTLALSPDGRILASATSQSKLKLWDVVSAKNIAVLHRDGPTVRCIAFSPDGKTLASGGEGKAVSLWDVRSGKHIAALNGHAGHVHTVAFSPDGKILASGSGDITIKLWNVASRQNIDTLKVTSCSFPVTFAPGGNVLASASADDTIELWDAATGKKIAVLGRNVQFAESIAFSPDGKFLASSGKLFGNSRDTTVKLWDVAGGHRTGK